MRFKNIGVTDSMPERIQITQQIELRKKQQAEDDKKSAAQTFAKKLTIAHQ